MMYLIHRMYDFRTGCSEMAWGFMTSYEDNMALRGHGEHKQGVAVIQ